MESKLTMLSRLLLLLAMVVAGVEGLDKGPIRAARLAMFVDELPDMPRVKGYRMVGGAPAAAALNIGMYAKRWKFHRDLPPTWVFAYGTSKGSATVPGPTIEALQHFPTRVTWLNHLPARHILPWDPTIPTANPPSGVPTVVHLHGGVHPPTSDGNSAAWFTSNFNETGPTWAHPTSLYPNVQDPGNLWYHDHAMGLTRVNLLAGLLGAYELKSPPLESGLGLPSGPAFDRHLILFDRSFNTDGSLYMNSTGNDPSLHPQWQPEYFGDAIVVNGKAWPRLRVSRRKYRLRILNASNARFFRLFFSNGLRFTHVGSDSAYLPRPVTSSGFLLAPSEIADVVVDFAESDTGSAVLLNDANYPYPDGDAADDASGKVMKFVIGESRVADPSRVPGRLVDYSAPNPWGAEKMRYIAMYEYTTASDEPTHLYLNGKSYDEPATETPREGTDEIWSVINLTEDNHPLHIHLGMFRVLEQRQLVAKDELKACMMKINDAKRCHVEKHAVGPVDVVPAHESGWKNVFKMQPGFVTRILVRFALIRPGIGFARYPFNATGEPGYVYHCHILDHEDNVMMRPLKLSPN